MGNTQLSPPPLVQEYCDTLPDCFPKELNIHYKVQLFHLFEHNKPALEKDRYKIREALIAAPGNSLIVADYGQLELRILAHLTNYKSMLEAFEAGGDFHSRTAMNMYQERNFSLLA
ncbi:DNA-directed DNA polymerase [Trifolium repens]|nr:DNA-directed DNA polymerase [Trifolium repens]